MTKPDSALLRIIVQTLVLPNLDVNLFYSPFHLGKIKTSKIGKKEKEEKIDLVIIKVTTLEENIDKSRFCYFLSMKKIANEENGGRFS